ncbi:uncharacterized protein LOC108839531 [Raphanus sativus]|uniref:Uncharacterized protein LOC108839531 n=1 Tax=Raphanus sativus TaxID=3726 RepID=A0A6J0M741_RAPSA|nr:uncharacterized protein LOC108839531 [Raphanus sativus]
MKSNRIKEENIWSCDVDKAKSWVWRSLLHLRQLASRFIRVNVGNGHSISFWWDIWTPFGKLIDYFGPTGPRELSIPLEASIANACNLDGWLMRGARSQPAETLQIYLTTVPLPSLVTENDSYVWLVNDSALDKFSAKLTWEALRNRAPAQQWTSYVWFKGAIPRHSFNMWLVQLDRLPTRARLSSWGINTSTACCLCNTYVEDRDHLFLRCEWSADLWTICLRRMGYSCGGFYSWQTFSDWLSLHDSVAPRLLKYLVASATIYSIWSERNKRYHDNISSPPETIFKLLDRFIRDAILSKRNQRQSCGLMQHWLSRE